MLFLKGVIVKLPFCFFFLQNVIACTNLGVLYLKHGKKEVNKMKICLTVASSYHSLEFKYMNFHIFTRGK